MPEGDTFDSWLTDFTKEVDTALTGAGGAAPATPEGRSAQAAFDQWWTTQQQPITQPTVRFDVPPPLRETVPPPTEGRERLLPEEWPARLEKLAEDRARLQQKSDALEKENLGLTERLSTIQSEIAEFESKLSRSRRSYEEHIELLDGQVRKLEKQLQEKSSIDKDFLTLQEQNKTAAVELSAERERGAQAERRIQELRERLAVQESLLAQARQEQSSQAGVLEELRKQASTYQHRLVQSKEATDTDVLSMRQELKTFLEDLRLIRNSMRKGE